MAISAFALLPFISLPVDARSRLVVKKKKWGQKMFRIALMLKPASSLFLLKTLIVLPDCCSSFKVCP